MSATANLARKIAKQLLDYADRRDAINNLDKPEDALLPVSKNAYGQRQVLDALASLNSSELTVRALSEQTGITVVNTAEKLKRLRILGYVEEVPETWPPCWRLTSQARDRHGDWS